MQPIGRLRVKIKFFIKNSITNNFLGGISRTMSSGVSCENFILLLYVVFDTTDFWKNILLISSYKCMINYLSAHNINDKIRVPDFQS